MKSISRTYPMSELRFYRRANGKAILQQRWCTSTEHRSDGDTDAVRCLVVLPAGTQEYFWQDVPMVSE